VDVLKDEGAETVRNCPEHQALMLDLARGRLDDEAGRRAEELRSSCPECAAWWRSMMEDAAISEIDAGVGEAFAAFAPPRRRSGWLAAAAAAVLALAVGGTTLLWNGGEPGSPTAPDGGASVASFDFESDAADFVIVERETDSADDEQSVGAILADGMEDGELSGWTTHS
jgi:hypothetical protein